MYYSLLIEFDDEKVKSKVKHVTMIDKGNLDDIYNSVVIPYREGKDFYVNGFVLSKSKITRIKIVKSHKSIKELRDYKQEMLPSNVIFVYQYNDIIDNDELVEDITSETLSKMLNNNDGVEADTMNDNHKVFVVHGRDELVKIDVARFLEHLGIKPIILHEQANQGKTVIEKIESYTNVGYGIILYTPCDKGGLASCVDKDLKYRARQNVVFEHGYLIGKLGRNRVCALMKDDIEVPNDISGVLYIKYREGESGWKLEVAKELKNAGYDIDLNTLC